MNKIYPTDLTDNQWNHIKDFFPEPKKTGRPREVEFRAIVNAMRVSVIYGLSVAIYATRLSVLGNHLVEAISKIAW